MTDREIILDSLMEILEKGQYSHLVLRSVLQKYDYLPKQQRSFIKRTCEGTIENKIYIDYVIDSFAKTKTPKMKPLIRASCAWERIRSCFWTAYRMRQYAMNV